LVDSNVKTESAGVDLAGPEVELVDPRVN
jgi:hypothetical protein